MMKNMRLGLLMLGLFLSACNSSGKVPVEIAPELTVTLIPATDTARPLPNTPTLTPTEVPTDTPTPSSTPIPTPTATWIVPVVQTVDFQTLVSLERFPSEQEGCLPPCWNGLSPGESPPSEIPAFFAQFGRSVNETYLSAFKHNPSLQDITFRFTQIGYSYYYVRVVWGEDIELIDIWYRKLLDLYGKESFLHPKAIVQNVGIPKSAKLQFAADYFGFLILDIPSKNTVMTYEVTIETLNGESKLCLPPRDFDVDIQTILYADSFDPTPFLGGPDFKDQSFYTGLAMEEFLSELTIIGRCIPFQYPE